MRSNEQVTPPFVCVPGISYLCSRVNCLPTETSRLAGSVPVFPWRLWAFILTSGHSTQRPQVVSAEHLVSRKQRVPGAAVSNRFLKAYNSLVLGVEKNHNCHFTINSSTLVTFVGGTDYL